MEGVPHSSMERRIKSISCIILSAGLCLAVGYNKTPIRIEQQWLKTHTQSPHTSLCEENDWIRPISACSKSLQINYFAQIRAQGVTVSLWGHAQWYPIQQLQEKSDSIIKAAFRRCSLDQHRIKTRVLFFNAVVFAFSPLFFACNQKARR